MALELVSKISDDKRKETLVALLRSLADQVESGEVTDMLMMYIENDRFVFSRNCCDLHSVAYATLLQNWCIKKIEE